MLRRLRVQMQRKLEGEPCERLSRLDAGELKRKCARFVADHEREIGSAEPLIPAGLSNRSADIWEPLLALADLAGGRWPELAREAALGLTGRSADRSPIGSLLLDILVVLVEGGEDRIFSRDLVAKLKGFGDRPWLELSKGKAVTELWLARQLGKYGIRPRPVRKGEVVAKGYLQADLMETFRRYIPRSEVEALKKEAGKA
jgi:putative DNA primase/helicase